MTFENRFSISSLRWDTKALIGIGILILLLIASQHWTDTSVADTEVLVEGQEYAISDILENQKLGSTYLLRENGHLVMGNVYLSQTRDGGNILTATTYFPQLVLIASYGSNGGMLQEQVMGKNKYPNVPAEDPATTSNPLFGRYEELEINAWAMELTLPPETETIKIYSNG